MATLTEWSELHLSACRATGVARGTLSLYRRVEQDYINFLSTDAASALNLLNARAWLLALRAHERHLSEATVKLYVSVLKVWASWLENEGHVEDSPLRKLKLPRVRAPVIEIFSPEHIHGMRVAAERGQHPERDVAILFFALDTMVRASELRSATIPPKLQQQPRDLSDGWLTLLGKGRKERRVHYEAETARMLAAYLDTRYDHRSWLFLGNDGCQLGETAFWKLVREWGLRADVWSVRCSPHTLRHTGATRWLQAHPGHIDQLRKRLGHETLQMTLRYASRADEEATLEAGPSPLTLAGLEE